MNSASQTMTTSWDALGHAIVSTLAIGSVSILLLVVTLMLLGQLKGYQVRKELVEDQNVALGIVLGSVILGVAIVIAAVASA